MHQSGGVRGDDRDPGTKKEGATPGLDGTAERGDAKEGERFSQDSEMHAGEATRKCKSSRRRTSTCAARKGDSREGAWEKAKVRRVSSGAVMKWTRPGGERKERQGSRSRVRSSGA